MTTPRYICRSCAATAREAGMTTLPRFPRAPQRRVCGVCQWHGQGMRVSRADFLAVAAHGFAREQAARGVTFPTYPPLPDTVGRR